MLPPPTPAPSAPTLPTTSQGEGHSRRDLISPTALYRLMAWLSPAYPVGAFSYSSGIEWAVEAGDIKDAESLRRWLAIVVGEGGSFCDAVFFAQQEELCSVAFGE